MVLILVLNIHGLRAGRGGDEVRPGNTGEKEGFGWKKEGGVNLQGWKKKREGMRE